MKVSSSTHGLGRKLEFLLLGVSVLTVIQWLLAECLPLHFSGKNGHVQSINGDHHYKTPKQVQSRYLYEKGKYLLEHSYCWN